MRFWSSFTAPRAFMLNPVDTCLFFAVDVDLAKPGGRFRPLAPFGVVTRSEVHVFDLVRARARQPLPGVVHPRRRESRPAPPEEEHIEGA